MKIMESRDDSVDFSVDPSYTSQEKDCNCKLNHVVPLHFPHFIKSNAETISYFMTALKIYLVLNIS